MNKKGQIAILSFFFALILFIIIWAVWLGSFLQERATADIAAGTYVGIEAFIVANINLWIFLGLLLAIFFFVAFGGGSS